MRRDTQQHGRIQGHHPDHLLKSPGSKVHHIADSAVQGQHTSSKFAFVLAAITFHFDFEAAQAVFSIRHAGGADGVGNQNCPLHAFRGEKHLHDRRRDVNAIGNDVGR